MSRRGLRANCVVAREAGGDAGALSVLRCRGRVAAGPGWVAMLWLPRAYIARTNPNGNSSLGGASPIMHTPVLTGRPCSRSLLVSLPVLLSHFHLASVSRSFSVLPHLLRNLRILWSLSPTSRSHNPTVPSPPTLYPG